MMVVRHMHHGWELLRWAALVALAAALALIFASRLAQAQEPESNALPPDSLPAEIEEWATPMGDSTMPEVAEEANDYADESAIPYVVPIPNFIDEPSRDFAADIWQVLTDQHEGRISDAVQQWESITLPCATELWQHVAMASAYIKLGDWDAVAESLGHAMAQEPDNAIVHYYVGIYRLVQAAEAAEWNDAIGPTKGVFVSHGLPKIVPNTRSMHRMAAAAEFEAAVAHAGEIRFDELLVPRHWPSNAALTPTVGDLLLAIGADAFEANSHSVLGDIYLENGALKRAEEQMDAAHALGKCIVYGYSDVAAEYEAQHRHMDAARAYHKAMKQGVEEAENAKNVLRNLGRGILERF